MLKWAMRESVMAVRAVLILAWMMAASVVAHAACSDPAVYGAIPDDGIDDAPALTAALAGDGRVCLRAGVYDLEYRPHAVPSIAIGPGQSITGLGPASVLRQHGDGGGGTWIAVALRGGLLERVLVYQDAWNLDPAGQTHMVQIEDSTGSTLRDAMLGPGVTGAGDCVRLFGATNAIRRALVTGVVAAGCWRSGISVQHGVVSAVVSASSWHAEHGQAGDYEPTSAGPVQIVWTGNLFTTTHGGIALTLSDKGDNGSVVTGNVIVGAVQAVRATNVVFDGNVITGSTAVGPVLQVVGGATGTRITHNVIAKPSGGVAGYAVQFAQQSGLAPAHVLIAGNRISQWTQAQAIQLEGATSVIVAENDITAAAWSAGWPISCRSITAACDGLIVLGNVIEAMGPTAAGVEIAGYGATPHGVLVASGNVFRGGPFAAAIRCDPPYGPVPVASANYPTTIACP